MIAPGYPQPTNATRKKWFRSIFIFSPDAIPPPPLRLTYGCRSGMGGLVSAGVRLSFYLKAQFSVRERGGHDSF
jgi:hypothetical protein